MGMGRRRGGEEGHTTTSDAARQHTGVKGHEDDGRADRLVDDGLGQDRLEGGSHEAAVEPFVPAGFHSLIRTNESRVMYSLPVEEE